MIMGKQLKISGIIKNSIVDGEGLRYVIFTQGCPHHCPGCHNPGTHDFGGGTWKDTDEIYDDIILDPSITGVTFSGGEPFMQCEALFFLSSKLKLKGYSLWSYSGFTVEELLKRSDEYTLKFLSNLDVLVDGRFILSKKSLMLLFRGSENQRLISVPKTLRKKKPVLWTPRAR